MELSEFNSLIHLLEIEEYNEEKGPITYISDILLEQKFILDLISREDNFKFNIGQPRSLGKRSKLMLTVSSILFLHRLDILKDVLESYEVIVLRSTILYLEDEIRHIEIERNKLINKSKVERFNSEKEKIVDYINICDRELSSLKENLTLLKKSNLIDIYGKYNLDKLREASEGDPNNLFIGCDLDSAFFAKNQDIYISIDDSITSEAFKGYFDLNEGSITNVAGLVNGLVLDDYNRYVQILEDLVDIRYEYILDEDCLLKLLLNIEDKSNYNQLKKLLDKAIKMDKDDYYIDLFTSVSTSGLLDKRERDLTENILKAE